MRDGDRGVRQLRRRVIVLQRRVVPLRDLAQVDGGERLRRDAKLLHAGQVPDDDHRAHHRRDVLDAGGLLQLLVAERCVAGPEVDGPLGDLLDAAAGSDRLVVDLDVRVELVVLAEPLGIERKRERRPRAIDQELVGEHSTAHGKGSGHSQDGLLHRGSF